MLIGRNPFYDEDQDTLFQQILNRCVEIPQSFSGAQRSIIEELLEKNPKKRLGCKESSGEKEINSHPFFASINWAELAEGRMKPPFQPAQGKPEDAINFEDDRSSFFPETDLSHCIIEENSEDYFKNFSFFNDKYTHW